MTEGSAVPRPDLCQGLPALTAHLEPWMQDLLDSPEQVQGLLERFGSPVNVHDFSPVADNAARLVAPARDRGVRARVFVARKANKTIGLIDAAHAAGLGVDVASLGELDQCLDRGVPGSDLVVSAAVKPAALLQRCLDSGAVVSLDNSDEADLLLALATDSGRTARVALRLAVVHPTIAPTRFGMTPSAWLAWWESQSAELRGAVSVEGVHFHLNGYSAAERSTALLQACTFVDALRERDLPVSFIDMGGGVPMRYLPEEAPWRAFWAAVAAQQADEVTWRGDRLGMPPGAESSDRPSNEVYPFWQPLVGADWMAAVLEGPSGTGEVAQALRSRDLELRLEPGRAMLDGCGMTLAGVAFRKQSSDGTPLVGLHMNRTQVRSTSRDFLVDPILVRSPGAKPSPVGDGFLVGAYCIEEELLARRRLRFPHGVALTDVVAFPNTGGYLMHIIESASHQIPLARNVVHADGQWHLDAGDAGDPGRGPGDAGRHG